MNSLLDNCELCPKRCKVNRNNNELGFCKLNNRIKIARAALHYWEEPCLSGKNGSGTIFFSGCNLKCIYCQNYDISINNYGKEISINRFSDICLELQKKGALNINLVTPTPYIPLIKEGLILARKKGLNIPIVYNTSAYENAKSLKELEGLIDIYLPDLKYYNNELGLKYSKCSNYFKYATLAIEEMYRQVGKNIFKNDTLIKGVIVRHLLLPGQLNDSKKIVKYLFDKYNNNIYFSLMNQYTPVRKVEYINLNKKVTIKEYEELIDYAYSLGIENCYIQEEGTVDESFIPNFNNEGV